MELVVVELSERKKFTKEFSEKLFVDVELVNVEFCERK